MSLFKKRTPKADGTQTTTYHYDFRVGGRRYQGSTGSATRREAEQIEKQVKARIVAEHEAAPDNQSVGAMTAKYYSVRMPGRTWAEDEYRFLLRIEDHLGRDRRYTSVTGEDVGKFVADWMGTATYRGKVVNGAGMNRMLACWRRLHNFARDAAGVPVQPIKWKLYKQKEATERIRYLTHDQARRLIEALPERLAHAAAFTLATGCRRIEAETLRWDRIDFAARSAEVLTKGGHKKQLPLGTEALRLLSMFPRIEGQQEVFDMRGLDYRWTATLKRLGIDDFHWHDLRHTHATWLGHKGVGLQVIQKVLGHSSIQHTLRYAHAVREDVLRAVDAIPNLSAEGDAINIGANRIENPAQIRDAAVSPKLLQKKTAKR